MHELEVRGTFALDQKFLRRYRLTVVRELPHSGAPAVGKVELVKIIFFKQDSAAHNLSEYLQKLSCDAYSMIPPPPCLLRAWQHQIGNLLASMIAGNLVGNTFALNHSYPGAA